MFQQQLHLYLLHLSAYTFLVIPFCLRRHQCELGQVDGLGRQDGTQLSALRHTNYQVKVSYGLRDAGYNFLLLDDGWTTCVQYAGPDNYTSHCTIPGVRDAQVSFSCDRSVFAYV